MPPITLDGTRGITTPTYNGNTTAEYLVPVTSNKNRIINGAMTISQRNGTSAVTIDGAFTYTLDRYACQDNTDGAYTVAQSSVAPAGFTNSLLVTITGTDTSLTTTQFGRIVQRIEGFNTADLGWGTASASAVTLSFWVRSSVTGTFTGSLLNNDANRIYAFTYTINAANTWEYETITIAGDTTGTWATNNSTGVELNLSIGAGPDRSVAAGSWGTSLAYAATGQTNLFATSGATFYITGVQLEKGSNATSFEYRQYGQELALCQRYFEKSYSTDVVPATNTFAGAFTFGGSSEGNGNSIVPISYSVKRVAPTLTGYRAAGTAGSWNYERNGTSGTGTITFDQTSDRESRAYISVGANWVVTFVYGHWTASAEL